MPAKAERVRQNRRITFRGHAARFAHDGELRERWIVEVDGRRDNPLPQRTHTDHHFEDSRGTQQVAGRGLGRGDRESG